MYESFIARQPIFDRNLNVFGYELLYRHCESNFAQFVDGNLATSQILVNLFSEFGLKELVGNNKAFINLPRDFLLGKYPIPFPPRQVVLEVLENTLIDNEFIGALKTLSNGGFKIALDDVTQIQDVTPLLGSADIVKLDIQAISPEDLPVIVTTLKSHLISILAEKVETREEFQQCKNLGFKYFQGYFFCKPELKKGHSLPPARIILIHLLGKLQDPDIDFKELDNMVTQDVSLSYKLLRLVNSAHFGFSNNIQSIRQSMAILGLNQLRGWLILFLLSETVNKPRELTTIALIRAKTCELIAIGAKENDPEAFFLVGLFSVLDAILDLTMEEVLHLLPLTQQISEALIFHTGKLGNALSCVLEYEKGVWDNTKFQDSDPEWIAKSYLKAIQWAANIERNLKEN